MEYVLTRYQVNTREKHSDEEEDDDDDDDDEDYGDLLSPTLNLKRFSANSTLSNISTGTDSDEEFIRSTVSTAPGDVVGYNTAADGLSEEATSVSSEDQSPPLSPTDYTDYAEEIIDLDNASQKQTKIQNQSLPLFEYPSPSEPSTYKFARPTLGYRESSQTLKPHPLSRELTASPSLSPIEGDCPPSIGSKNVRLTIL